MKFGAINSSRLVQLAIVVFVIGASLDTVTTLAGLQLGFSESTDTVSQTIQATSPIVGLLLVKLLSVITVLIVEATFSKVTADGVGLVIFGGTIGVYYSIAALHNVSLILRSIPL